LRLLKPTEEALREAAGALRRGELVGMPTETVYGLAALATDAEAVRNVFLAKGRPSENPLIVHVATMEQVAEIAAGLPDEAKRLAAAFWPGPLTIVLAKQIVVPDEVTAGLPTVAVRMPAHPVARRLIELAGPVAAPSANRFMQLSPTRPEHLDAALTRHLALVLDGGSTELGLESTVVDGTVSPVTVLRPGGISRDQLREVLGYLPELALAGASRKSPGQHRRHYAPRTVVRVADKLSPTDAGLTLDPAAHHLQVQMPHDPVAYGARLYAVLHELDALNLPEIVVQAPPREDEWETIWDRLRRATSDQ
jgi:L-threonylcarbamoyladenylate synthase